MSRYRKINVSNLEIVQSKLLTLVLPNLLIHPRLFFPKDQNNFHCIPELLEFLESYSIQIDPDNTLFAFYVIGPNDAGPIHIDWGNTDYSLNIPLKDCAGTLTEFYKTNKDPILIPERVINGTFYRPRYAFDESLCTKIDEIESNVPMIMHIKSPHRVVNPTKNYRINFLIRHTNNERMSSILNGVPPEI